jgi:hypothetical protein
MLICKLIYDVNTPIQNNMDDILESLDKIDILKNVKMENDWDKTVATSYKNPYKTLLIL